MGTAHCIFLSQTPPDTVHTQGPRVPADEIEGLDAPTDGNYVNPEDAPNGTVFPLIFRLSLP